MRKISYGFLTISLIVLLGSCGTAVQIPSDSRIKEVKYITAAYFEKNAQMIALKKDDNTIYTVVEFSDIRKFIISSGYTTSKFIIKEIKVAENLAEIKYEINSYNEDLLKAYIKNNSIHLFSSLKIKGKLVIIERIVSTKDFNNVIARVVFSVAPINELNDLEEFKESKIKMPDNDIIYPENANDGYSVFTPLINSSPDTSKITISGFVKKDSENFDIYTTSLDLLTNKIIRYVKVKNEQVNSLSKAASAVVGAAKGILNVIGGINPSEKESNIIGQAWNIFEDCANNVLSKGIVNNYGSTVISTNLLGLDGIKTFDFIEMNNGEINEIQIQLWDELKAFMNNENFYIRDYCFIPKSNRVYEFIGLLNQDEKPKLMVKMEINFNNKEITNKKFIAFDDSFREKYNDDDKLKFNNISDAYYSPKGDLIIGFEEILVQKFTKDHHHDNKVIKEDDGIGLQVENLYVGNFGKNFDFKWLFKDDDRRLSFKYDTDPDDVKAEFIHNSKNIKFDYMATKDELSLVENELDVDYGTVIKNMVLVQSIAPFRTGQRISLKNNSKLYGWEGFLFQFIENSKF
jgi:hypothetical protein